MQERQPSQKLFLKCSLPGTKWGGAEHSGERPNPCVSSSKPDNIWPRAVSARAERLLQHLVILALLLNTDGVFSFVTRRDDLNSLICAT